MTTYPAFLLEHPLDTWSRVPYTMRHSLPNTTAIYTLLFYHGDPDEFIYYCGSALSLRKRWQSHHVVPKLPDWFWSYPSLIAWCEFDVPERKLRRMEKEAIAYWQPPYNELPGPKPRGMTPITEPSMTNDECAAVCAALKRLVGEEHQRARTAQFRRRPSATTTHHHTE